MTSTLEIARTRHDFTVIARLTPIGDDLLVVVGGGRAHIGAVALAQPAPGHLHPERVRASTAVLPVMGHREDVVVQRLAHHLCEALKKNVVVLAGLHSSVTSLLRARSAGCW